MRNCPIRQLLAATCLLAAATAGQTAAYAAQPADEADEFKTDGRIIVVSIKNPNANLLDYAGAANTIDAQAMEDRQVTDLSSLSYVAPNVSLDPIGTFKGVANFSIRGLGINSSIPSIDPAVGLFVDGVYMGINAGTVFDLLDVRSVEILRGPQGVAFGRNTTGGAVLINTADPSRKWMGHASLRFEGPLDRGRGAPMATGRAVVSGPLSETIAMRLAVLHSDDGGYFRNSLTGQDFGRAETTVVRAGLSIEATDRLTLTAKAEWADSRGDGATTHNNGWFARDKFTISVNEEGFYRSKSTFATLRADYELDSGVITNIAGWRDYSLYTRNDIDSSPVTLFHSDTGTTQEQWSNELFYAGNLEGLAYTVGGFLFHQNVAYEEDRNLLGLGAPFQYGGGRQSHDVQGLYGQADYDLTPAFTISAGLRWSREKKHAQISYVRPRAACSTIDKTCPIDGINPATSENNGFADTRVWTSLSPRFSLTWRPADNTSTYASWTRGFRSGGYNLRITQPVAFEQISHQLGSPAFDAEQVDSFELGLKWHSTDRSVRVNAAIFWMEVGDLQREVNVPSNTSGLAQSVFNTADARLRGAEIEAEFAVTEKLKLSANLGYIGARYTRAFFDIDSSGTVDQADLDLDLPRAPEWTWGGSVNWTSPLSDTTSLFANVFFQHRSRYAYTDNNWGYNEPSERLDASVGVNLGDPNISVTFFGRNLLDQVQFGGDTQLGFAGGPLSDGNNRPYDPNPAAGTFSPMSKGRTLGLELSMDF